MLRLRFHTLLVVGAVFLSAPAYAGQLDAEISADYFRADSNSTSANQLGAGADGTLVAQELGLRLRLDGFALKDDRLELHIDYRGREPFGGDLDNATRRLLYQAEVEYAVVPDKFGVGLGRFIAPSALFLPVDGVRLSLSLIPNVEIEPWVGRRAITSSLRNVAQKRFLPAGGAAVRYTSKRLRAEVAGALARDEGLFLRASESTAREYDALNLFAHAVARPLDSLDLGASLAFVEQGAYVLGPGWRDVDLELETLGLFNGLVYADWRVVDAIRLGYDFHLQDAAVFRSGTVGGDGGAVTETSPDFFDNQVRATGQVLDIGWIRAAARHRVRSDRTELRYSVSADVNKLGVRGLFLRGWFAFEDVSFSDDAAKPRDLDRLLWSAALGYHGYDLDIQVGGRFIDRSSTPVSGRTLVRSGAQPDVSQDLAPFVLEAQRVMFLRAFYGDRLWFGGLDFERNLEDSEVRFLLQFGTFLEAQW